MTRDGKLQQKDAVRRFHTLVEQTYSLFLYNLLVFIRTTAYARKDADLRASKHLPSEEDRRFTSKLFENDLLQSLAKDPDFLAAVDQRKLRGRLGEDAPRLLYTEFSKKELYTEYIMQEESTADDHRRILLELYRFMSKSDNFREEMEERFSNWVDDHSLIIGASKRTIKAMPVTAGFLAENRPEEDAVYHFGEILLKRVIIEDEKLLALIEPVLRNWDAERLAVLDMILIKMAICELMYFPTIPTKVTLNEFVEIAKLYSTDKSKDFINGILDRLMKQLMEEGKINKEGRGLIE